MNRCINCNKLLTSDNKLNGRCWKCDAIYQEGYKAGLQSHPTPTDLLTEKQTFGCSVCLLSDCRSCPDGTMPCQQARPTEQARKLIIEKLENAESLLAEDIGGAQNVNVWGIDSQKFPEIAEDILKALPFPDEQAIRADERKVIGVWGNKRCLTHHTSMNNILHRNCTECWDFIKSGELVEEK